MTAAARTAFLTAELDRTEWLRWRRSGIGGSDIAALLGLSTWSSPYRLWCDKSGILDNADESETDRQRLGKRMESVLELEFHDATGLTAGHPQTRVVDKNHDWRRATLDALAVEGDDVLGVVEFKTDGRFAWPDGPPPNLRAQLIWQMGICGLDHGWLAVLHAGFKFLTYPVEWDADARADWSLMCERADRFWHDHVLAGEPPPVDGSAATARTLAELYPTEDVGTTIDLGAGAAELLDERTLLKSRARSTRNRLLEIDNELRRRMADAELGAVDGEVVLTLRTLAGGPVAYERAPYRKLAPATKKDRTR